MSRWKPSPYVKYGYTEEHYTWTQTPDEVTFSITLPSEDLNTKRDIVISIEQRRFECKVKGEDYVCGELEHAIDVEESTWSRLGKTIDVTLAKGRDTKGDGEGCWWGCVIKGHHVIDVKRMESTKYLDDSLLKKLAERDAEEANGTATEPQDE